MNLNDIVVVGYGVERKKDLTGAVSIINGEELTNTLQGKVAGVNINNVGEPGASGNILIRGISGLQNENPLYVIDGIIYDKMPLNITPDMLADVTVLKPGEAISIYGQRAADGVVIISTKLKNTRTQFRNYAYWQPQLFTDENGNASFVATYPDNITGWQTFVLAMDKKRRIGKAASYVKSYKPLSAQLSMPQFLIEGDSVQIVGKLFNYSNDNYTINSTFSVSGNQIHQPQITVQYKSSAIQKAAAIATSPADSLRASFSLQTSTGFKDEEERKIPVLKKGTEETNGNFWILQNDTTVNFKADEHSDKIELYAQNNTLDLLLDELQHLKQYPYYCNEQTASKLKGLLLEKKIKNSLKQSFTDEKSISLLLQKLQKAQLYDGGWSWWENGKSNLFITNYVINVLLLMRGDALTETNIRNGLLYLQNQLSYLHKDELLTTLATMSNAHHLIDYTSWLQKINFDSLTQYQQWLFVKTAQQQNLEYKKEMDNLLNKSITGVLGSLHWGEKNYRWYNDDVATTILAFDVLQHEKNNDEKLKAIIQYFLEQRKNGYWINTVQSASITGVLLPYILSVNTNFLQPGVLKIGGDTSFVITTFPFKTTFQKTLNNISISKTGGGISYLTLYQHYWQNNPAPVDSIFSIKTYFKYKNNVTSALAAGEIEDMVVEINAGKEADYVMIEIPIAAGCTYADKNQNELGIHKEFMKNKVVLFAEHLNKGPHAYTIKIESRYTGNYILNPAKISLMYFPTFYGRNEMKKIDIQ